MSWEILCTEKKDYSFIVFDQDVAWISRAEESRRYFVLWEILTCFELHSWMDGWQQRAGSLLLTDTLAPKGKSGISSSYKHFNEAAFSDLETKIHQAKLSYGEWKCLFFYLHSVWVLYHMHKWPLAVMTGLGIVSKHCRGGQWNLKISKNSV